MTSFIAACGSGRSTSVIPAVPAAWSVTTIAFIVIVSSAICFFPVVIAARDYLFQYAASILSITAETLLRRSLLPFAHRGALRDLPYLDRSGRPRDCCDRSEEHTSELQSLMRISYAVFCLKKKKHKNILHTNINTLN